jgi:hypothetical protein
VNWLSSLFRKKADPVPLWTGRILTGPEFQRLLGTWEGGGDETYAEVNSAALPAFYNWFQTKLFDLGLTRWNQRQDCDDFANLYADLLQLRFYLAQWERHPLPEAEALAVARFWYRPSPGEGHAINAIATERGLLYIEPQTGQLVTVSPQAPRIRCIF